MNKIKAQNTFDISDEECFAFESYSSKWRKREVRDIFLQLAREVQSLDTMFIFKRYIKLKNILSFFTSGAIRKKLLLLKRRPSQMSVSGCQIDCQIKLKQKIEESSRSQLHQQCNCAKNTEFGCSTSLHFENTLNLTCKDSAYSSKVPPSSTDDIFPDCDRTTFISNLALCRENPSLTTSTPRLVIPLVSKASSPECQGIGRNVIENGKIPTFTIPNRQFQRSPPNVLPDITLYSIPVLAPETTNVNDDKSSKRSEKNVLSRKKQRCEKGLENDGTRLENTQDAGAFSVPVKRKRTLVADSKKNVSNSSWKDTDNSPIKTKQVVTTKDVFRDQGLGEKLDNADELVAQAYEQIMILKARFDSLKGNNAIHKYKQMQHMLQVCLDSVNLC